MASSYRWRTGRNFEPVSKEDLQQPHIVMSLPFKSKPSAGKNCISAVPREGTQRISPEHAPNGVAFFRCFLGVCGSDKSSALPVRQIGPVYTFLCIAVIWSKHLLEDPIIFLCVVQRRKCYMFIAGLKTLMNSKCAQGRDMVLVVEQTIVVHAWLMAMDEGVAQKTIE
jgi:hypothetical protein